MRFHTEIRQRPETRYTERYFFFRAVRAPLCGVHLRLRCRETTDAIAIPPFKSRRRTRRRRTRMHGFASVYGDPIKIIFANSKRRKARFVPLVKLPDSVPRRRRLDDSLRRLRRITFYAKKV